MHIANIIEEGKMGGPQARIVAVATALATRIKTTVIMPTENSAAFRLKCDQGSIGYRALPITRITREWRVAFRYLLFSVLEIRRLKAVFCQGNFDVVHVSGGSWQVKGVLAGKLAKKKVLWHLNDTSMPRFIRWLFMFTSRWADGFIFASQRSRAYYSPFIRSGKPEFVIPAPVDTASFSPKAHNSSDDEIITQLAGQFVVGTVCNINPIKGLENFIHTASLMNGYHDKAQFIVVGPVYKSQQRYFHSLQQLCSRLGVDNIHFVGSRADVRPLLSRFDAYVCSSKAESSPMAVWEAMAMTKPVISTDVGDVPIYIRDGENGFIVPVDEPHSIADRLKSLMMDKQMRFQFGEKARETVRRHLDIKRCADLHAQAYAEMI